MKITKNIFYKALIFSVLFFVFQFKPALTEELNFKISMLGVKAANISFVNFNDTLKIKAKSNRLTSLFYDFDYNFEIAYANNYLPISYKKIVNQEDYNENRIIIYNRNKFYAKRISFLAKSKNKTYTINKGTRDFYTALYYLRTLPNKNTVLYLDAAGRILKSEVKYLGKEKIKIGLGKFNTDKFEFTFKVIDKQKKERSDMLTNNLQKQKNKMYFWFSCDKKRLPLKAKYAKRPFAAYWELINYK